MRIFLLLPNFNFGDFGDVLYKMCVHIACLALVAKRAGV